MILPDEPIGWGLIDLALDRGAISSSPKTTSATALARFPGLAK